MLAYYGMKANWLPLYRCLADMPVEVGEVFFFCLGWDRRKDDEQKMVEMAKAKQRDLQHLLQR